MHNYRFKTLSPESQIPSTIANPLHIAIAGTGYVGLVSGICMAHRGHYVTCVDIDEDKIAMLQAGKSPIYELDLEELMHLNRERITYTTDYRSAYRQADAIFIGVGTPEQPDGSANLTYIAASARQIAENVEKDCLVVVKSTVPVGTNDKVEQFIKDFQVHNVKVEVASNPEFLAQGTAIRDTLEASRIIIGTENAHAEALLRTIYEPFDQPVVSVSRRSAEMIKYAANNFLALKISFINDIANLCEMVGADIEDVSRGIGYDNRIGRKFLNAGIGFGGSCFPKDTKALNYLAAQHGYELQTVRAAINVNKLQKTRLYQKACQRLISFKGLKVAVLGLTFKPGTDDLREAPSLVNIAQLLKQGADLYIYDPAGMPQFKQQMTEAAGIGGREADLGSIHYAMNTEEALADANVCFIFTEWGEIASILPEDYKKLMRTPLVYDGRNIYDVHEMRECGVEYYSIGRL